MIIIYKETLCPCDNIKGVFKTKLMITTITIISMVAIIIAAYIISSNSNKELKGYDKLRDELSITELDNRQQADIEFKIANQVIDNYDGYQMDIELEFDDYTATANIIIYEVTDKYEVNIELEVINERGNKVKDNVNIATLERYISHYLGNPSDAKNIAETNDYLNREFR